MRHFVYSLLGVFFFVSCVNPAETKNEVWEIDTDSLYAKCANLKGLGNLIIDKTTFQQLSKDKYISNAAVVATSSFYSNYWGVSDFDLSYYIRDNYKQIKQVVVGSLSSPYTVGELKFKDIVCAFLRDTLVAISLDDDYYLVEKVFIERYGNGRGNYSWYCKQRGKSGEPNFYLEKREHKERVWENESVRFERYYDWNSLIVRNELAKPTISKSYCLFYSKKRYEEFLSTLKEAKESYRTDKQKKMQQSIDAL